VGLVAAGLAVGVARDSGCHQAGQGKTRAALQVPKSGRELFQGSYTSRGDGTTRSRRDPIDETRLTSQGIGRGREARETSSTGGGLGRYGSQKRSFRAVVRPGASTAGRRVPKSPRPRRSGAARGGISDGHDVGTLHAAPNYMDFDKELAEAPRKSDLEKGENKLAPPIASLWQLPPQMWKRNRVRRGGRGARGKCAGGPGASSRMRWACLPNYAADPVQWHGRYDEAIELLDAV